MNEIHTSDQRPPSLEDAGSALHLLSIEDLGMLVAIEARRTLTGAAAVLNVTQSALSHRLAQLESRLSQTLYERRARSMNPTAIGKHLTIAAQASLTTLTGALREIQSGAVEDSAEISIATECYTCYSWLPRVLTRYREEQKSASVKLVLEATRRPMKYLRDGQINLAIMSTAVRDKRFKSIPLFRDEIVAVVSKSHPWAEKQSIQPKAFAKETLLAYTHASRENSFVDNFLRPSGIKAAKNEEVSLTEALLQLVGANLGVATMARWAVMTELQHHDLAMVRLGRRGLFRQWSAVVPMGLAERPHMRHFLELAAKAMTGGRMASG